MAYKIRTHLNGHRDFHPIVGPIDVIRETEVGWHANTITFPGVSTCTTITVQTAGAIYGLHLAAYDDLPSVGMLLTRVMTEKGAAPIQRVAFVGCLTTYGNWNATQGYGWPAQAATVRGLLATPGAPAVCMIQPGGANVDIRMVMNAGQLQCSVRQAAGGGPWQGVQLSAV